MRLTWMTLGSVVAVCVAVAFASGAGARGEMEAPVSVPPLVLEDFEAAPLGARPFLWKERGGELAGATVRTVRAPLDGDNANKALQFAYAFPAAFDAGQGIEVGPAGQALPGSLTAFTMQVHGDGSANAIGLRLRDRNGERFEWRVAIGWKDWKAVEIPLVAGTARRSGTPANGVLDLPLTFEAVRLSRQPAGQAKGEVMVDNLAAVCRVAKVLSLYDAGEGVKPEAWKAVRNRSTVGLAAESLVPRNGKDVPALKLEYEYENTPDSSVEYQRALPAGDGHGTLIAEVFGDGSNNVLRFRMLDREDRPWQATWAGVLVDWSGWKTLYLDTRTLMEPEGRDPTKRMEKFPAKFYSLILDDCSASDGLPGVESGRKGEIYLGRLLFGTER